MIQRIKLSLLENNIGQIEGLPSNPRYIKDDKFELLKNSLSENPEMLELRELIVFPLKGKYIVIAGNMRLRAAKELGFIELPCKVLESGVPIEFLRAITIKDNVSYGMHDHDLLSSEWDEQELLEWGLDIPEMDLELDDEKEEPLKEISKKLTVECDDLPALESLYSELQERGFIVTLK